MTVKVKEFNILTIGVGGQGVVLLSEILGKAATREGITVKGYEVLGMAVRGGPVISMIRLGSDALGPLIPLGTGNLMIAMESVEALRNLKYMAPSCQVLLNTQKVYSLPVLLGKEEYPGMDDITQRLEAHTGGVAILDALDLAQQAGSALSTNVVMLGAAFGTGLVPIGLDAIKQVIEDQFPAKLAPVNLKAFELGFKAYQQMTQQ